MKSKIFTVLFCLPFLLVGLGALGWGAKDLGDWLHMKSWETVPARLLMADTSVNSDSDGGTTYKATARYEYHYKGQNYTSERVAISGGSDNIGSFQEDFGRRLERAYKKGKTVDAFVNPDKPSSAVLNRDMRWGMLAFKMVFALLFGGVGGLFMFFAIRSKPPADPNDPRYATTPWLANKDWQKDTIISSSKLEMYMAWGFATVWNLISGYLPFVLYDEIFEKKNYIAAIGLLFPLVGIGLIIWAISRTMEWRRFGRAPLVMDPFPGSINGHVAGTIDLNYNYDPNAKFKVILTNFYSYVSGSGDNRRRNERAKWQDSMYAYTEAGYNGTRLVFQFDVPDGLNESDADPVSSSYYLWRVSISADIPGVDFSRDYEIPVYKTDTKSRGISDRAITEARSQNEALRSEEVKQVVPLRYGLNGAELFFPFGRNFGSALVGFIIGAVFAGAGGFMVWSEGMWIFGGIFSLVGGLIVLGSVYAFANSLQVFTDDRYLHTVRRIFGIPASRKKIHKDQILDLRIKSSSQKQTGRTIEMSYHIRAMGQNGEKLVVAEGILGSSKAKTAIKYICEQLGLDHDAIKKRGEGAKNDDKEETRFGGRFPR